MDSPRSLPPLFLKSSTLAAPPNSLINGLDVCYALERASGKGTVDGVQRIGGLFRIYLKTEKAREDLLISGFNFNGCNVSLLGFNPFSAAADQDTPTTKIIIGGIPLSVAESEIEKALIEKSVKLKSNIKLEHYRDHEGKLTSFKTGRRFVYSELPTLNLDPFLKIGLWKASIFYREQIRPKKSVNFENENNVSDAVAESSKENLTNVQNSPINREQGINRDSQIWKDANGKSIVSPVSFGVNETGNDKNQTRKSRSGTRRSDKQKQSNIPSWFGKHGDSPSRSRSSKRSNCSKSPLKQPKYSKIVSNQSTSNVANQVPDFDH